MSINERYKKLQTELHYVNQQRNNILRQIEDLQDECPHDNMKAKYGSGLCLDCGYKTQSWFCKDSPTKERDYYDPKTDEYDEDCCIYCGHPEERK